MHVQGLNWVRTAAQDKLKSVILAARRRCYDFVALSEMHSPENAVVALEEWVLVTSIWSGVLLGPAAQRAWGETEQERIGRGRG